MKGIFVGVDGKIEVKNYETTPLFKATQEDLQGDMERVKPRGLPPEFCFMANEEGVLLRLPVNLIATKLYGHPWIAGNVIIFKEGFTNEGIDIVEMTEEDVEVILTILEKVKG